MKDRPSRSGLGLDQHIAYVLKLFTFAVSNPIKVRDMAELYQQVSYVAGYSLVIELRSPQKPMLYQF